MVLLRMGFAKPACRQTAGALLPHRFTLTDISFAAFAGGLFSVALSVGFPRLAVSQHPTLWSPDFPPACICLNASALTNTDQRQSIYLLHTLAGGPECKVSWVSMQGPFAEIEQRNGTSVGGLAVEFSRFCRSHRPGQPYFGWSGGIYDREKSGPILSSLIARNLPDP